MARSPLSTPSRVWFFAAQDPVTRLEHPLPCFEGGSVEAVGCGQVGAGPVLGVVGIRPGDQRLGKKKWVSAGRRSATGLPDRYADASPVPKETPRRKSPAASLNRSHPSSNDSPDTIAPIGVTTFALVVPPPSTPGKSHKATFGKTGQNSRIDAMSRLTQAMNRTRGGDSLTNQAYLHELSGSGCRHLSIINPLSVQARDQTNIWLEQRRHMHHPAPGVASK